MYYILLLIIVVAVIWFIVKQKKSPSTSEHTEVAFKLIDSVFSPAERSFYGVLKQAVDGETEIFVKVRVADVLMPKKGISKSAWQSAFNKISRKHFDFLLCNKSDLSVICGIELNDQSHKNNDRKQRDNFLVAACNSANLPLVMVNVQRNYSLIEIKQILSTHISSFTEAPQVEVDTPESAPQNIFEVPQKTTKVLPESKVCPKCSTELIKRMAKKGPHAGKEFLACSAYPKCKYIEQINA